MLSYPILSYPILSYPILSYPTFSLSFPYPLFLFLSFPSVAAGSVPATHGSRPPRHPQVLAAAQGDLAAARGALAETQVAAQQASDAEAGAGEPSERMDGALSGGSRVTSPCVPQAWRPRLLPATPARVSLSRDRAPPASKAGGGGGAAAGGGTAGRDAAAGAAPSPHLLRAAHHLQMPHPPPIPRMPLRALS